MAATKRKYAKEEFARRGDEVFETAVRPHLTETDVGKFAAIDIETGSFEVDEDELAATDRLATRRPDAQIWLVKIGSRFVHRFGGKETRSPQ